MANRLLPTGIRQGALLDVGCGIQPLFLTQAKAAVKVGLDRLAPPGGVDSGGVRLVDHDVVRAPRLPFDDAAFDAVTMLAVLEHIPAAPLHDLLRDIRRVLTPGGRLVLTTPAAWTDPLLRFLARVGVVSAEEIAEHETPCDRRRLRTLLEQAGFRPDAISIGSFEVGMNLWATADR
jgi:SAM-dependent methyltransferase